MDDDNLFDSCFASTSLLTLESPIFHSLFQQPSQLIAAFVLRRATACQNEHGGKSTQEKPVRGSNIDLARAIGIEVTAITHWDPVGDRCHFNTDGARQVKVASAHRLLLHTLASMLVLVGGCKLTSFNSLQASCA
jgi:hypothetical protein